MVSFAHLLTSIFLLSVCGQMLAGSAHSEEHLPEKSMLDLTGRWQVHSKGKFGMLEIRDDTYHFEPAGAWVEDESLGGKPFFFVIKKDGTIKCAPAEKVLGCTVNATKRIVVTRESDCSLVIYGNDDLPWVRIDRCD